MATEDPTGKSAPVTAAEDRRTQSVVLALLLEEHPAQLALSELKLALNGERQDFPDNDRVARAVRDLVGAGLLHRAGPFVVPSRAALHFDRLETA
jgi:hypothetical protein